MVRFWHWARIGRQIGLTAAVLFYITLVIMPVLLLLGTLIAGQEPGWVEKGLSSRQLLLLGKSALFSMAVALSAMLIGILAATRLLSWDTAPWRWLRWLILPLIIVPVYVHAAAWQSAFELLADNSGSAVIQLKGWVGAGVVETLAYLPLTTALALYGMLSIDRQHLEAAIVYDSPVIVLRRVLIPLSSPHILAGGCIVFVLSLTDYTVPAIFLKNTYAQELFVQYSLTSQPSTALIAALPLLVIAGTGVYLAMAGLRKVGSQAVGVVQAAINWKLPGWLVKLQYCALLLLVMQIIVPVVSLILGTGSLANLSLAISAAGSELGNSAWILLCATGLGVPVACGMATLLAKSNRMGRLLWSLVVLPLSVPAPLVGIGLIYMLNTAQTDEIYNSVAMPALAALARFLPFGVLVFYAFLIRLDTELLDVAAVFERNPAEGWLQVHLPLLLPGVAATACVIAVLTLSELGATLLVAPPARATLTMRIYSYMHYGSSASVAGLNLVVLVLALLIGALALYLFNRNPRVKGSG